MNPPDQTGGKRLELRVKGKVQKVGYRTLVQEIGLELRVTGYVENLRDLSVKVVCEGEPELLERFAKAIAVRQGLVQVKTVKIVTEAEATGEFEIFDIKRGDIIEELGGRLDSAVLYLQDNKEGIIRELGGKLDGLSKETSGGFDRMGDKLDGLSKETSGGFDRMGDKLDGLNKVTDEGFGRMGEKLDGLGERMSEGSDKLSQQTSKGFDRMGTKFDGMGERMSEGLDKLSHQTVSLEERTHEDFTALDGKYHTVSSELKEINTSLKLITSMVGQALEKGRIVITTKED